MMTRGRTKRCFIAAAIAVAATVGAGSAVAGVVTITQDFNSPGQLSNFNNFVQFNANPASTGGMAESTTGGVAGSGSISNPNVATTDQTLTYAPQGFDFSQVGQTITESIVFRASSDFSTVGAGGVKPVQLGFLTLPAAGFNGNANQGPAGNPAFASIRINMPTAASANAQLQGQDKTAAGGTSNFPATLPTLTLTASEYYQISLSATQNGGGNYTISGAIQDMGTDGQTITGAPVTIAATARTAIPDLATTVYAGFRTQGLSGGANYDNFSVTGTAVATPEPVSAGLFALGGVGLLARRRRRGSHVM